MDTTAEKVDPSSSTQHGSRVFGDCDRLFRHVMRHVMGVDNVKEWEEGRGDRMKVYDGKREDEAS